MALLEINLIQSEVAKKHASQKDWLIVFWEDIWEQRLFLSCA